MAIVCTLNNNILRSSNCGYSLPKVSDIYIVNYDDLSGVPAIATSEVGQDEISGITLQTGKTFYHIVPNKDSVTYEDTLVVEDNGNKYRHASLSFTLGGAYTKVMHANLDALALGRFFVVVKTADGSYLGLGRIVPLEAEVATLSGGGDTNGVQVTLAADIAESPLTLTSDAVAVVTNNPV